MSRGQKLTMMPEVSDFVTSKVAALQAQMVSETCAPQDARLVKVEERISQLERKGEGALQFLANAAPITVAAGVSKNDSDSLSSLREAELNFLKSEAAKHCGAR